MVNIVIKWREAIAPAPCALWISFLLLFNSMRLAGFAAGGGRFGTKSWRRMKLEKLDFGNTLVFSLTGILGGRLFNMERSGIVLDTCCCYVSVLAPFFQKLYIAFSCVIIYRSVFDTKYFPNVDLMIGLPIFESRLNIWLGWRKLRVL